ncbi:MAG: hypothetical protein O8C63_06160 [Candidatus Methanoperedens sp.]|nr:hypothetical protein [Candidatus Methanoperedens sp.]
MGPPSSFAAEKADIRPMMDGVARTGTELLFAAGFAESSCGQERGAGRG